MNKLEIQGQGFPVTKQTFDFMQKAYSETIKHLCKAFGNNLILYGCELAGSNRTAGAIVIDGELLPFEASPNNAKILISETVENAAYQNGTSLPAYKTRTAKCSSTGTVNLADLKRIAPPGQMREATPWKNATYMAGFGVYNTFPLKSRIDESGKGAISGGISNINNSATGEVALAQLSFNPSKTQYVPMLIVCAEYQVPLLAYIKNNGILYMNKTDADGEPGYLLHEYGGVFFAATVDLD